jgi:hypothetical protein
MTQKYVVLYHYVKMCSKNLHKNISFRNHLKVHQEKNIGYILLGMFLNILCSLNSFQIISHVFIIYLKHYYENTLKKFTTLKQFVTLKHEKPNNGCTFI